MAPAAVPKPILEQLSADLRAVVQSAELAEKTRNLGIFPKATDPAALDAWMAQETARWADIAKLANIKAE